MFIPSVEFKLANTSLHQHAVKEAFKVVLNKKYVNRILPLEPQMAYKVYLGSEKDIGDAVFLYTLFRDIIDLAKLHNRCRKLG